LIGYRGLKARGIDYSRSHLWRLEAAGRFPKRVHVGSGRVSWIEHEVDNYLLGLASARDAAA
jgi:prophage regulatory protein